MHSVWRRPLFFTVRIGVVSATATVGNVRVMNARLRNEKRHQSQQPADTSHDDLKKKYESLQKDYKRLGQAFQNQQEQNQELTTLLEEREKEAEELANLVQNKDKVVEKPREALLKRKEGHRRTLSGGATQRPTRTIRRPTRITTATPADGRHSRQHPQPGQHTRTI